MPKFYVTPVSVDNSASLNSVAASSYARLDIPNLFTASQAFNPTASQVGMQIRINAADPFKIIDNPGTNTYFRINEFGQTGIRTNNNLYNSALSINTGFDSIVGLVVRGNSASQSADLQQWQNSGGTTLAKFDNGFNLFVNNRAFLGTTSYIANYTLYVAPKAVDEVGVVFRGLASQTGDLQQWQNSSGTVLAEVQSDGTFIFSGGTNTFQVPSTSTNEYPLRLVQSACAAAVHFQSLGDGYLGWIGTRASGSRRFAYESNPNAGNGSANFGLYLYDSAGINSKGVWTSAYSSSANPATLNIPSITTFNLSSAPASIPITVRGSASQTANLTEWQDSSAAIIARVDFAGRGAFESLGTGYNSPQGIAWLYVTPRSTGGFSSTVLQVNRGLSGQTGDLQQWQNSSGSVLANINSNGVLVLNPTSSVAAIINAQSSSATANTGLIIQANTGGGGGDSARFYHQNASQYSHFGVDSRLGVRTAGTLANSAITVATGNDVWNGIVIKGNASQTANLQEWQNSSGSILSSIKSDGSMTIGSSATAAYGLDVYTGAIRIWNGITGAGQTGTIYLGDGSFSKTFGSQWTFSGGITVSGTPNTFSDGGLISISTSSTRVPIIARGSASQSANLQEWQNSSGTALATINQVGNYTGPQATLTQTNPGAIVFRIFGEIGQTADLQQWNRSSSIYSTVNALGHFTIGSSVSLISTSSAMLSIYNSSSSNPGIIIKMAGTYGTGESPLRILDSGNATRATIDQWGGAFFNGGVNMNNYLSVANWLNINQGTLTSQGAQIALNISSSTTIGAFIRAAASQTANLQEWQNSASTAVAYITPAGSFISAGRLIATAGSDTAARLVIGTSASTQVGITVQGTASQAVDLQQWQSSGGNVVARVDQFGGARFVYAQIISDSSGTRPLNVRGASGQTANLQEWQNSSASVLASVDASGNITASGNVVYNQATNSQSGSAYTLALTDSGKFVEMTSSAANTITVPASATVAWAIGSRIDIVQYGAGTTTISPAASVTVNYYSPTSAATRTIKARYGAATLIYRAANEWLLVGNLT